MTTMRFKSALAALVCVGVLGTAPTAMAKTLTIKEFKPSADVLQTLQKRFADRTLAKYERGTWAPLKMNLTDADLKLLGLPSKKVLLQQRYRRPTTFRRGKGGKPRPAAAAPGTVAVAGAGYTGIRPGAFILFISGNSIGWCSAAHVYGTRISTAGHCGGNGDIVTMIGAVGDNIPVLLDIGAISSGTGDGGVGNDWALISVYAEQQHLLSPTMAFWGGPRGLFTKTGAIADVNSGTITADPLLAQQIVHYGHGAGIGAGGTPRSGTAIHWGANHYMFFGALTPGDSGSGSNTVGGDTVGATMEAAGINTHIYVDPLMRDGLGIMAGTRATKVGTPTNGQLVGYPVPLPLLP
jgi:hypothetical protein